MRKRARKQEHENGQHRRKCDKKQHRRSDRACGLLGLALTDPLTDQHGRPHGQPGHDTRDGLHDLTAGGDRRNLGRRRNSSGGTRAELSDDEQIDRAVQRLQKDRKKYRHRKFEKRGRDLSLGKVGFLHILYIPPPGSFSIIGHANIKKPHKIPGAPDILSDRCKSVYKSSDDLIKVYHMICALSTPSPRVFRQKEYGADQECAPEGIDSGKPKKIGHSPARYR